MTATTPLWLLLQAWPLLAACVLALVPAAHARASAATLAVAGSIAVALLGWRMPGDATLVAVCVVVAAGLVARCVCGRRDLPRSDLLASFVSAGCLDLVGGTPASGFVAGLLGVQAACAAASGLETRARPAWEALQLDLAGAALMLLGAAMPQAGFAPVCTAFGLCMLAGFGPRPAAGSGPGVSGVGKPGIVVAGSFERALLGIGAVVAIGRGCRAIPGAGLAPATAPAISSGISIGGGHGALVAAAVAPDIVLILASGGVCMAILGRPARPMRAQIACAAMAATLPGGAWWAGLWCVLALLLALERGARPGAVSGAVPGIAPESREGVASWWRPEPLAMARFAASGLPPWPGFLAAFWLLGACWMSGGIGPAIALALAAAFALAGAAVGAGAGAGAAPRVGVVGTALFAVSLVSGAALGWIGGAR